ncbi:hypothetical protein SPB21_13785 [Leptothoe sp. ISB3NOV94-8A]
MLTNSLKENSVMTPTARSSNKPNETFMGKNTVVIAVTSPSVTVVCPTTVVWPSKKYELRMKEIEYSQRQLTIDD